MISTLLLIIIYLSFISLGLPDSILGSAWPAMKDSLCVPIDYAGYISMIIAAGTVISSILSEKVIKKFGTSYTTIVSVLLTAISLMGFSFSHSFIELCIWAIPLGIGAGAVDSALNNFVALHYEAKHMNWLHCFWGVGASAGPIIMSIYLVNGQAWTKGYSTIGILQFTLVGILLLSIPLWRKIRAPKSDENSDIAQTDTSYKRLFSIPGLRPILIVFFCYCSIESTTGLWGASYLVEARGIMAATASRWIAFFFIGITAGRFISGFISMKLTNRQLVRLGQIIIAVALLLMLIPNDYTLLASLFLVGLGCAPIFPSLLHETPKNFGSEYSQAIMGLQMASAYIGTTIMPPIFGKIAASFGFTIFPMTIGTILVIKVLFTEIVNRKSKRIVTP